MSSVKPFKIGFIGAGGIAGSQMRLLKKVEGAEVVAVADVSETGLNKVKEEFGVQKLYTDYRKMLKEVPELDAISVCTPNGLHAENTIVSLQAGKHVMVEKPMAMNAAEGQQMIDTAKKAGKHLIIGFQHRFGPQSQFMAKQVAAGELGKILYVRCQALRKRGIPNWGVFGRKDLQGGGPMIDIGVHILEMAHYIIGAPRPITATGNTFTYYGDKPCNVACGWPNWDHKTYTVEDLAVGMIRFEGGAMLTVESSFVAHLEKDIWNIQIMGEKGGASYEPAAIFKDHNGYMMNMAPSYLGQWDQFETKMRHFVEVCRDGKPNQAPAEHGLMVQKMLDGVYASAEAGREVVIE